METYDSFFQALGLSLGNADVYAKFAFFLFMILFLYYLKKDRNFDPELGVFVSKDQKEAATGNGTPQDSSTNPMQQIELNQKA